MAEVVVPEAISGPAMEALQADFDVLSVPDLWQDENALMSAMQDAKAIIVRNQTQVSAALLENSSQLQVVARAGAGLDNVDTEVAAQRGIVVTYAPRENSLAVAELAMGFLLNLARDIPRAHMDTRAGNWNRTHFVGTELFGKVLGLVGFGRIGQLVARRAVAFGMSIVAYDKFLPDDAPVVEELGVQMLEFEHVLQVSDFISCHVPLLAETQHLFSDRQFSLMKESAYFLNTSRGEIVDEQALYEALSIGRLCGAAVDVRESEPPELGGLATLSNVIVTPHIGAFSQEAQRRVVDAVCHDVRAVLGGKPPRNPFSR
jgi:D-3-phosphoglycerate dehydrogenase / 2-oxoglutarate reductase